MSRDELQRQNIVRIFQLSNAIQTYIDKILKPYKLTTKQFFMMIIIGSFSEDPRIGQISERFGTSRQNVKQVLNKLQQSGYITLYKDLNDSRILRAQMTEKAGMFWASRSDEDVNSMNTMFEVLSVDELFIMQEAFVKLAKRMEEMNN